MTNFGLTIWADQKYGSATALGVIGTSFLLPFLLLMPLAGIMVDKYNRKMMMMVSDLFAITATVGIFILNLNGRQGFRIAEVDCLVSGIYHPHLCRAVG